MKRSILRTEKRGRGRPKTNPTSIHLTLEPKLLASLDEHIAKLKDEISRPEAIRRLVETGLATNKTSIKR